MPREVGRMDTARCSRRASMWALHERVYLQPTDK
jgi:hypothetical protein